MLWDGTPLVDIGVVNENEITASVSASLVSTGGTAEVVVSDTIGASSPAIFTIENPVPEIASIEPSSAVAGQEFTITLNGSYFVQDSIVSLDGITLAIEEQSTSAITVFAPLGTFTVAGVYTLTVTNPEPAGGSASTVFTITHGELASITLTPPAATVAADSIQTFSASGYDQYDNLVPLTLTWSLTPSVAGSVMSSGSLTSQIQAGTTPGVYPAALVVSAGTITRSADLTVTPGAIAQIVLSPNLTVLTISSTQSFSAAGYDAFGNSITELSLSWDALPDAGAIVSSGPSTATFMAGTSPGTYLGAVQAISGSVVGTAGVVVLVGNTARVEVTPSVISLPVNATQLFTATGYDAAENVINQPVFWLPPAGGQILSSGPFTALYKAGTVSGIYTNAVQAVQGAIVGSAAVSVTPDSLAQLILTPASATIVVSATQAFAASGYDAYGNPITPRTVTWQVYPSIAGVIVSQDALTAVFQAGVVAGYYPDAVEVSAFGITRTADITVQHGLLAQISVTPPRATLGVSTTQSFAVTGYDEYGNWVPSLSVTWSVSSLVGTLTMSDSTSAHLQVGTRAGVYPMAVVAQQGAITGSADITVTPDLPANILLQALPDLLYTNGISTSLLVISATDRYNNAVSEGTGVSITIDCPGSCSVTPSSGFIGQQGVFTAVLTSNLRAVTQTITSTIYVTASISPALAPHDPLSAVVAIHGVFTPYLAYLPVFNQQYPLSNHSVCSALPITPPSSVLQGVENSFNLYRFTAQSDSHLFSIKGYTTTGSFQLYRIVEDNCATTSQIVLNRMFPDNEINNMLPVFEWSVSNVFTPGLDYMLAVYNVVTKSLSIAPPYLLTVTPGIPAQLMSDAVIQGAEDELPYEPIVVDGDLPPPMWLPKPRDD